MSSAQIDSAKYSESLSYHSSTKEYKTNLLLTKLKLEDSDEFEGLIAFRLNRKNEWSTSQPFSFKFKIVKKSTIPTWVKHDGLVLAPPLDDHNFKEATTTDIVHQIDLPETINDACLAGAGRYLVVQHGKKLQLLDLKRV